MVFILEFNDCDDFQIIGVFSTLDKAEKAKNKYLTENKRYDDENMLITQHEIQ